MTGRHASNPASSDAVVDGALTKQRHADDLEDDRLGDVPVATSADSGEVLAFIEQHRLFGRGIGYSDAHLLASVAVMPGSALWTRDRRLHATAQVLNCAWAATGPH